MNAVPEKGETMTGHASVYGYRRNPTLSDYPEHLAALFFVSGCNFLCRFCHNAALANRRQGISWARLREVAQSFQSQWVSGAVISGGEPTVADDLPLLLEFFRSLGWAVKLDTNGSCPDVLWNNMDRMDYVAMDVKSSLANYPLLTGFKDTGRIRESIRLLQSAPCAAEFRMTILEPFHTDSELHAMGELVHGQRPVYLQPFLPREDLPYIPWRSESRTSPAYLEHARSILLDYVPVVAIRGN